MSDFFIDESGYKVVRKSDISAAQLNLNFMDQQNNRKAAINVILKSGEKASLLFTHTADAQKIIDELVK